MFCYIFSSAVIRYLQWVKLLAIPTLIPWCIAGYKSHFQPANCWLRFFQKWGEYSGVCTNVKSFHFPALDSWQMSGNLWQSPLDPMEAIRIRLWPRHWIQENVPHMSGNLWAVQAVL